MVNLYASPNGSGNGLSPSTPASLADVKTIARTYCATNNVTVYLRGGTYNLSNPLTFTADDSGGTGFMVLWRNYPDETPILDGGERVTGWTLHDAVKNIWKATTTAAVTRQLWINGERKTRSRHVPTATWTQVGGTGSFRAADTDSIFNGITDVADIAEMEIHSVSGAADYMYDFLTPVSISRASGLITLDTNFSTKILPANGFYNQLAEGDYVIFPAHVSYFENSLMFLNQSTPGQWYHDGVDTIYYVPESGENMASVEAVIPTIEKFIVSSSASPVKNITFSGITFQYSTWTKPSLQGHYWIDQGDIFIDDDNAGAWVYEAGAIVPACIEFEKSEYVNFYQCTIRHTGGAGLKFARGCTYSSAIGNELTDISASGIIIGGFKCYGTENDRTTTTNQTTNISVLNNKIHDIGVQYFGGCGVFVGFGKYIEINDNDIYDCAYSGVSLGYGSFVWTEENDHGFFEDFDIDYSSFNEVAQNNIYNGMLTLQDGAGIYTMLRQPNTTIHDNYIHAMGFESGEALDAKNLMADEGSRYESWTDNVIEVNDYYYNQTWMLLNNVVNNGSDMTITGNYFTDGMRLWNSGAIQTRPGNTAVSGAWPTAAQDIINASGIKQESMGYIDSEGNGIIFGWKPVGSTASISYGTYTLISFEQTDTMWKAVLGGVADNFAQFDLTITGAFSVDSATSQSSEDNITLEVGVGVLQVNDLTSESSIDNISFIGELVPDNMVSQSSIENLSLSSGRIYDSNGQVAKIYDYNGQPVKIYNSLMERIL